MTETNAPQSLLMLSGGLDSTVAAFLAAETTRPVLALGFDYGQRANRRELAAGYAIAQRLGVTHRTVALPFFREISKGALTEPSRAMPHPTAGDLDDLEQAQGSAQAVWVPNRNAVFIAVAAAFAESAGADVLVVGFNAEEARTFPDNSAAFVQHQNRALEYSTARRVQVEAPTASWSKADIVRRAMERDWPLELVWSCYEGEKQPCLACESCLRFQRALDAADARPWFEGRLRGETR
ncbi:MAG: 7-cyano-7-deazaguanine synthase QueC [Planctomycetes bacterium]|nr:7-cyano-7-deazaguanine synthase QueC [Planctomycetota bacterium]